MNEYLVSYWDWHHDNVKNIILRWNSITKDNIKNVQSEYGNIISIIKIDSENI